jgi:hypothetical protein
LGQNRGGAEEVTENAFQRLHGKEIFEVLLEGYTRIHVRVNSSQFGAVDSPA